MHVPLIWPERLDLESTGSTRDVAGWGPARAFSCCPGVGLSTLRCASSRFLSSVDEGVVFNTRLGLVSWWFDYEAIANRWVDIC